MAIVLMVIAEKEKVHTWRIPEDVGPDEQAGSMSMSVAILAFTVLLFLPINLNLSLGFRFLQTFPSLQT